MSVTEHYMPSTTLTSSSGCPEALRGADVLVVEYEVDGKRSTMAPVPNNHAGRLYVNEVTDALAIEFALIRPGPAIVDIWISLGRLSGDESKIAQYKHEQLIPD